MDGDEKMRDRIQQLKIYLLLFQEPVDEELLMKLVDARPDTIPTIEGKEPVLYFKKEQQVHASLVNVYTFFISVCL